MTKEDWGKIRTDSNFANICAIARSLAAGEIGADESLKRLKQYDLPPSMLEIGEVALVVMLLQIAHKVRSS